MKHGIPAHGHGCHDDKPQDDNADLAARVKKLEDHISAMDATFKKNDLARRVEALEKK